GQADPALLMLLAELHELEGDAEAAERYLQQAATVATGERGATILEQLGDLHAARGEHREALAYYLAAAERSPSHAAMLQRRYREVMAAADSSVQDALTTGWSAFADYVHNGVGEREVVYGGLSQVRAQLEEALRFVDGVHPPEQVRAEHVRRQFAYSLAVEATVAALSYVDLGTEGMMERAELRQREALAELSALRSELGAAGD
ncbi:MAG: tetratricopeptide repeat protein, partial [Armatimonadota bacterium]